MGCQRPEVSTSEVNEMEQKQAVSGKEGKKKKVRASSSRTAVPAQAYSDEEPPKVRNKIRGARSEAAMLLEFRPGYDSLGRTQAPGSSSRLVHPTTSHAHGE